MTQRDGRVAITALVPLARLDAAQLRALAALDGEVRIAADRTVTLVDLDAACADDVERGLAALGLVVAPRSGWTGLTACAGSGCCPRARLDVRAIAAARARVRRPDAPPEHWVACRRRCGARDGVAVRGVVA
jgi:sulfite reductase beta subunit-like hemoprotein